MFYQISQLYLDGMNVAQSAAENRAYLDECGGIPELIRLSGVSLDTGLTADQVEISRKLFGTNEMPKSPTTSYFWLLLTALSDTTLVILIIAACISFAIGYWEDPKIGWIEGAAIFIAVFLVSNISAFNDYSKELQFRELEASSQQDEKASVFRMGKIELVPTSDLVVGDIIILQGGDMIPADCVIICNSEVSSSESALTGESEDMRKSRRVDCFLLSSCLITDGDGCRALVIGIGLNSQWGKIKANLVTNSVNTPLQDKLEIMTTRGWVFIYSFLYEIGYGGMVVAVGTFIALFIRIWADHDLAPSQKNIITGVISAFILAVTVVVVAIPEGLPLAVTISLAYSSKKMYNDNCFIRQLAACETMGNATTICSDKTGTLTENRMTVVEGWFGDNEISDEQFDKDSMALDDDLKNIIAEQCSINRTAYLIFTDAKAEEQTENANETDAATKSVAVPVATVIGNKTEGALINMIRAWGYDYDEMKAKNFNQKTDRIFSFNSDKKRSSAVIVRADGTVRVYCKGAAETLLEDCLHYRNKNGQKVVINKETKLKLERKINGMAERALRTLLLCHKDYPSLKSLPRDWKDCCPDSDGLCCDCIVGIIDPLRADVKEAVATATRAGVFVRMVTGDNIHTACAIARQCGILTPGGLALEGPEFRKMTPKQLDEVLPSLQVLARSSPHDKFLLVTRLNGHSLPKTKEEWQIAHKNKPGANWEKDRDLFLPGYQEEWISTRPDGGQVVGVTGDGTNDAPALKGADVGLAMGISGTKVAQGAADVVILDDKFSSIVKAIVWGRTVYDNIRKFLQFQLTVNVVALLLVFIGAVAGFGQPLNAVMMLWVNLVMDTFGALALGTEPPTSSVLKRKPYKRNASLISVPMIRNILCQSCYQVTLLFVLLFLGAKWFDVRMLGSESCLKFRTLSSDASGPFWDLSTMKETADRNLADVSCSTFSTLCAVQNSQCLESGSQFLTPLNATLPVQFSFSHLDDYKTKCLDCEYRDYTHGTIIFNTFVFCQVFNEYTSRKILNEWNMFSGVLKNPMFLFVSIITLGFQIFLVELGGDFVKTSPLTIYQWIITVVLGLGGIPIGILMRFLRVSEDPNSFFALSGVAFVDNDHEKLTLESERDGNTDEKADSSYNPASSTTSPKRLEFYDYENDNYDGAYTPKSNLEITVKSSDPSPNSTPHTSPPKRTSILMPSQIFTTQRTEQSGI